MGPTAIFGWESRISMALTPFGGFLVFCRRDPYLGMEATWVDGCGGAVWAWFHFPSVSA